MRLSRLRYFGCKHMRSMRHLIADTDPSAEFIAEGDDARLTIEPRTTVAKTNAAVTIGHSDQTPRSAFRAWPDIRARLRAAGQGAVLLDFDGTLVNLRRRPSDVRMPPRAKRILQRLVRHPNSFIAIVSGRRVRTLRSLFDVKGLHYFGLHGAERDGKSATLNKEARRALDAAKRA